MKSDVITIDNQSHGFDEALEQTKKSADFRGISHLQAVQLQLMTEEMLSMARSVTGELNASFWIEFEGAKADLHLTTQAVLDKEKRAALIASSTSRKNETAKTFLGSLRDMFEEAMAADAEHFVPSNDILKDLPQGIYEEPEWDGYERSILRNLADEVKIGIQGHTVDITVSKRFNIQD